MLSIAPKEYRKLIRQVPSKKGWKWSKSPYGNSFYYLPKNEKIDWGYKPQNSIRISDHWNWNSGLDCPVKGAGKETINKLAIAIYENGYYEFI